jgi:hypothetical protein
MCHSETRLALSCVNGIPEIIYVHKMAVGKTEALQEM